jgi:hypothetical protein
MSNYGKSATAPTPLLHRAKISVEPIKRFLDDRRRIAGPEIAVASILGACRLSVSGAPLAGSTFPVMGDGLALDVHGNVYIAVVTRLAVVKIDADDFPQETIAVFNPNSPLWAPLGTPNSVAFGTGKGGRQTLFVSNPGLFVSGFDPGLVKIEAELPGRPLP